MGMSASQARLLSITARLTNNEFRSQTITNAKLRLATESKQASQVYMDSLNSQELMYMYYGEDSENQKFDLTPSIIYEYTPLKNQYAMLNPSGKMLVANLEAVNFEETNSLSEFLKRYDLIDSITITKPETVKNPEYDGYVRRFNDWKAQEPDPTDPIYWIKGTSTESSELYDKFLWATAICYGAAMRVISKELGLPNESVYDSQGNIVLSYDDNAWTIYSETNSGQVLISGSDGDKTCYNHVLSHLLQNGTYTTTIGTTVDTSVAPYYHWWDYAEYSNNRGGKAESLALILSENSDPCYSCCGEEDNELTASSSDLDKLLNDYYIDESGNKKLKTIQQKIVDLDYAMSEMPMTAQQMYDAIQHFVNHDLMVLNKTEDIFDEEGFNGDHDDWKEREPEAVPETITRDVTTEYITVSDKDKAQWYTNLWYKMNGSDSANLIHQKEKQSEIEELKGKYIFTLNGVLKSTQSVNYEIFDQNLVNNAEWLQFALEHGVISLAQAQFYDPTQDGEKVAETKSDAITWKSIIYTNAPDIVSQNDEEAIAKAEVEYKKALKKIQSKDKKYDQDLKKLDAEHNALQTEYESIKEIIQKNTDRSFKAFS